MGGICKIKGREKGLWFEIQCLQNDIIRKTGRGEDCDFEMKILKSYKKYSERDYKQHGNPTASVV